MRRPVTDVGAADDQRRPVVDGLRLADRLFHGGRVHAVDLLHVPVIPLEARDRVVVQTQIGGSVQRHKVVVVEVDHVAESEVTGQ